MDNNLNKIKEVAQEFFSKTDLGIELTGVKGSEDATINIDLRMGEPQILIGEQGQTLNDVQRLLRLVLVKRDAAPISPFRINLDINDYKKKKAEYLKDLARSLADEVSLTKKEKYFPPMTAYERRVIHVELASRADVMTESVGMEPSRTVVIKPRLV
jgi:spoIIIJ-associated protein